MTTKIKSAGRKAPGKSSSLWITVLYCLFTLLYTVYITFHTSEVSHFKGDRWWYFIKFLLAGSYLFFLLQGLLHKTRNWGILLLLPLAILGATIAVGYGLVWILRLGGGTLLDHDRADMILASLLFLTGSFFSIRLIGLVRNRRRAK